MGATDSSLRLRRARKVLKPVRLRQRPEGARPPASPPASPRGAAVCAPRPQGRLHWLHTAREEFLAPLLKPRALPSGGQEDPEKMAPTAAGSAVVETHALKNLPSLAPGNKVQWPARLRPPSDITSPATLPSPSVAPPPTWPPVPRHSKAGWACSGRLTCTVTLFVDPDKKWVKLPRASALEPLPSSS